MTDRTRQLRGQALVETALVLPILLLLMVLALDMGRAFLGSIGVHNLARIGANYAAANPDDLSWGPTSRYQQLMMRDATGIGCEGSPSITPPVFAPDPPAMGGDATVTVTCRFRLITPLAGQIVGELIDVTAASTFPVRGVCLGCESAPPLGSPPAAPEDECNRAVDLTGLSVEGARVTWRNAGFVGEVIGPDPEDDGRTVLTSTPQETADADGCLPPSTDVVVTFSEVPTTACPAGQDYIPSLLGMGFGDARTTWSDAGFEAANFAPTSAPASSVVKTQTFGPGAEAPDACGDLALTTVTVTTEAVAAQQSFCKVPDLHLLTTGEARPVWDAAEFTGEFAVIAGEPEPFTIQYQSLVAHTYELCTAPITVGPDPLEEPA